MCEVRGVALCGIKMVKDLFPRLPIKYRDVTGTAERNYRSTILTAGGGHISICSIG